MLKPKLQTPIFWFAKYNTDIEDTENNASNEIFAMHKFKQIKKRNSYIPVCSHVFSNQNLRK